MSGITWLDIVVIAVYVAVVIWLGQKSKAVAKGEEGFFLAGRKLGKLYQFFLNFGNATEAQGAVSTATLVYRQGASGAWPAFQTVFFNPYYWFMNAWFRRVRLITVADMFTDRLGSRSLAAFYAVFMIVATVVTNIGFGNYMSYKICASLLLKPEAQWTAAERASVDGFKELKALQALPPPLSPEQRERLDYLTNQEKLENIRSFVSWIHPESMKWMFYVLFITVVGAYIVIGGMAATALNEAFQGVLIIVFSFMLLPIGISALGGWEAFAAKIPKDFYSLFPDPSKTSAANLVSPLELGGLVLVSLVQINAVIGNMGVSGSAKNEYAARFGAVSGTYAKRVMIIMWSFVGMIALAHFGAGGLSDPDTAWGMIAGVLLKPGLLGLMLAGLMAAMMSTVAAQTMAISALFVRNVYGQLRGHLSEREVVSAGRWTIVVALAVSIVAATAMRDVKSVIDLLLTIGVPFGWTVFLMYFWRRLTVPAVWVTVLACAVFTIVGPMLAPYFSSVRSNPSLTLEAVAGDGRKYPVYFDQVVRQNPDDANSAMEGRKRLNLELLYLRAVGMQPAEWTPSGRKAARYFVDGLLPLVLLLAVSLLTRPPAKERVDLFMGKMKTPVGATPELEVAAMDETRRHPGRYDHLKIFPGSNWEFCRWDKTDTIGFVACLAISGLILGLFLFVLNLASAAGHPLVAP